MEKFDKWAELSEGFEGTEREFETISADALAELAAFAVSSTRPDLLEKDEDGEIKAIDILDMQTIFKIIEVCGGIKLNDPKLMETALAAMQAQAGTS